MRNKHCGFITPSEMIEGDEGIIRKWPDAKLINTLIVRRYDKFLTVDGVYSSYIHDVEVIYDKDEYQVEIIK
tara:strand:+ start:6181 stop:6396 length:216 start_codon:yes stop_codon:yes gene_type:complete